MRQNRLSTLLVAAAAVVSAQRPSSTPICDYYTTALLKNNTADNQYTLLTLLVNTVVIGNYTQPNVGVVVPGILAPGTYNGTAVNLLPYFNGSLATTNQGGSSGVMVNFLDGGGAAPLKMNKPANDMTSKQYFLLTHLYQFFGALLGCSMYSMPGFPAYGGDTSMYKVHSFMGLDSYQMGYFITQVGLAAASFGVAPADIEIVADALASLFDHRCSPPTAVLPNTQPELQAICLDNSTCPLQPSGAVCDQYSAAVMSMNGSSSMSTSMSMTSSGAGGMASSMSGMTMNSTIMTTDGMTMTMPVTTTMTGMSSSTSAAATATVHTAGAAVRGANLAAVIGGVLAMLML